MFFHRAGDSPLLGDFFFACFYIDGKSREIEISRKENCKIV